MADTHQKCAEHVFGKWWQSKNWLEAPESHWRDPLFNHKKQLENKKVAQPPKYSYGWK